MRLLTIIGTRPEAVKTAPVLLALRQRPEIGSLLVSTGQHGALLDGPLRFFGLRPDHGLTAVRDTADPLAFAAQSAERLGSLLKSLAPDQVIVQGDTASAMAGAWAGQACGIPVAHVEAGLRTYAPLPWPEEPFRREIDRLAALLLAPTPRAAAHLVAEANGGAIHVTGNSGIDALQLVLAALAGDRDMRRACDARLPTEHGPPLLLVTLHRRENIGENARILCDALTALAAENVRIVMPLHPNPQIAEPVRQALDGKDGIHLLAPLDLAAMARAMRRAALILTDSGGVQEEAPSLGKAVLVARGVTERPEGIEAGLARLVPIDADAIVTAVRSGLAAPPKREPQANPYGDGRASGRIVAALLGEPFAPFQP